MKWYSVKEHSPILSQCCMLLAVRIPETGRIFLSLGEWNDGWKDWEHKFDLEEEFNYKVLYFCYPEPIPKAYESLMDDNFEKNYPK